MAVNYNVLEKVSSQILELFKKACRVIEAHSQPLETLHIRPTLEDLKQDWKNARDALKAYKEA